MLEGGCILVVGLRGVIPHDHWHCLGCCPPFSCQSLPSSQIDDWRSLLDLQGRSATWDQGHRSKAEECMMVVRWMPGGSIENEWVLSPLPIE
eukprot:1924766-Rhodomonas_salina.3